MNADERNPGQQGYGQQSPQQSQGQQAGSQQQQQSETMSDEQDGGMSTGQAAYGNSGEADVLSQDSSSMGKHNDAGQSASQGSNNSLFSGSKDDMGGSASSPSMNQQGSQSDQDFADQGQGALNEDLMGSDGTTDIEVERSQGRESDVEGKGL